MLNSGFDSLWASSLFLSGMIIKPDKTQRATLQNQEYKWASTRENLSSGVCEHRRRPACASAQSDQRPCYSRFGKYHIRLATSKISIF